MNSVSRDNQQAFPVLVVSASLSFLGAIGCRSPVARADRPWRESIARGASRSLVAELIAVYGRSAKDLKWILYS